MKKIIALVVSALLVVSGVMIYSTYADRKAQSQKLEEISNRIVQLNIKKNKAEKEMAQLNKELEDELRIGSYMVLFFDDLTENLYTDIYPLLDSYGLKGTIVMKNSLIPGEADAISVDHFNMLLDKGWDTAIGCNDDINMAKDDAPELLGKYLDEYITKLEEADIEIPLTFCFDDGRYSKRFESVIGEYGFKVIRHFGETGETYASAINDDGFYYVGSGWYCAGATKLEDLVVAGYEKQLTFSVSTRRIQNKVEAEESNYDCTTVKYKRMLSYFEANCPDMEVCTVSELYDKKKEQLTTLQGVVGEYNVKIAAIKKEIEEIEDEIKEITSELYQH
ncbi:MAG: hypothetical protein ACI3XA_08045 [Clostridia bacterium]